MAGQVTYTPQNQRRYNMLAQCCYQRNFFKSYLQRTWFSPFCPSMNLQQKYCKKIVYLWLSRQFFLTKKGKNTNSRSNMLLFQNVEGHLCFLSGRLFFWSNFMPHFEDKVSGTVIKNMFWSKVSLEPGLCYHSFHSKHVAVS